MNDRPSWMPSDEELDEIMCCWGGDEESRDWMKRFIERAALKAQIEALDKANAKQYPFQSILDQLNECRARLAELEEK